MSRINAPRGTADVLPAEVWKWQAVERIAREISEVYHFAEIRTPVYEHTDLFHRGVGETSDIVQKETFTFKPRPESESITLRPEGTAGVVRAAIENGLIAQEGARAKVYYLGPNFRYERPQKGRLRIHHQFGVEAFGIPDPEQDVECILLQMDFYRRCGLQKIGLRINCLGDREDKLRYREALVEWLVPRAHLLSDDSQSRLNTNPLRILDSKDPRDVFVYKEGPLALNYLSDKSFYRYEKIQALLVDAGLPVSATFQPSNWLGSDSDTTPDTSEGAIKPPGSPLRDLEAYAPQQLPEPPTFAVDPRLVRGFDYYTGTVWEVTAGGLGAQNAIGGGGRYDNLVEQLGGRPTPGVGFGSGIERLLIALDAHGVELPRSTKPLVWLISIGEPAREANWKLLRELRNAGIVSDTDPAGRSPKAQFKLAGKEQARFVVTVGDDELKNDKVAVKDFTTSQQTTIDRESLIAHLKSQGA